MQNYKQHYPAIHRHSNLRAIPVGFVPPEPPEKINKTKQQNKEATSITASYSTNTFAISEETKEDKKKQIKNSFSLAATYQRQIKGKNRNELSGKISIQEEEDDQQISLQCLMLQDHSQQQKRQLNYLYLLRKCERVMDVVAGL